jgi:hypothetical protein
LQWLQRLCVPELNAAVVAGLTMAMAPVREVSMCSYVCVAVCLWPWVGVLSVRVWSCVAVYVCTVNVCNLVCGRVCCTRLCDGC